VSFVAPPANSTSRCLFDEGLSLLNRHGVLEPVTAGGAHIVHAHRRNRFDARVDLGGADDEAGAAANPDGTDLLPID
jgi:hypothetical protein